MNSADKDALRPGLMTNPGDGICRAADALRQRYLSVRDRLDEAVRRSGREPRDVTLVAVSKFHPAEAIRVVAEAGHAAFGESYAQEALPKQDALRDLPLEWHYIGRLQTNKAKDVTGRFALIHTVDSLKLAETLSRRLADGTRQGVLLQINVGQEAQKAGVEATDAEQLAESILALPNLRLHGLMCLPPFFDDGEAARPYFAALREQRDRLAARLGVALPCLSMGMSGDFVQAVEEGATLVRIGTDIFGERTTLYV